MDLEDMPLLSRKVNSSAAVTFGSSSCCITAETSRVYQFAGSFTDEIDQFEILKNMKMRFRLCVFSCLWAAVFIL